MFQQKARNQTFSMLTMKTNLTDPLYVNFLEVLRMLASNDKSLVDYHLEELEGDFYTFLHADNLEKLRVQGLIDNETVLSGVGLRERIQKISPNSWTSKAFCTESEWLNVRLDAANLLLQESTSGKDEA